MKKFFVELLEKARDKKRARKKKRMENLSKKHEVLLQRKIEETLDYYNLEYELDDEKFPAYKAIFPLDSMIPYVDLTLSVVDQKAIFILFSLPLTTCSKGMAMTTRTIKFINTKIITGNFDLHGEDGLVTFRSFMPCVDTIPTYKDISYLIEMGKADLEQFASPLLKSMLDVWEIEDSE